MIQKEWDMQSLSNALLQSVRRYGIKEVSMGQYEAVCKKIVHFSSEQDFSTYYPELKTDYDALIDAKINDSGMSRLEILEKSGGIHKNGVLKAI